MNNRGIFLLTCIVFGLLLNSCALVQPDKIKIPKIGRKIVDPINPRTNVVFNAVLRDPVIRNDFNSLKSIAKYASTTSNSKAPKFSDNTIKKLNQVSEKIVQRLNDHYHLDAIEHRTHVSIARYKKDSCYQYFNSKSPNSIGKSCDELTHRQDACNVCNIHVEAIKARNMKVINSIGWHNQETTVLISTFRLKNNDLAYIELQLSHPK